VAEDLLHARHALSARAYHVTACKSTASLRQCFILCGGLICQVLEASMETCAGTVSSPNSGKDERWHQTLERTAFLLDTTPARRSRTADDPSSNSNNSRYHESINNDPADVYFGRPDNPGERETHSSVNYRKPTLQHHCRPPTLTLMSRAFFSKHLKSQITSRRQCIRFVLRWWTYRRMPHWMGRPAGGRSTASWYAWYDEFMRSALKKRRGRRLAASSKQPA